MVLAFVGIYAENLSGKIAPSHDLITLRGINWKLALFGEFFTVDSEELLDKFIPHKLVIGVAEPTIGIRACMSVGLGDSGFRI
jgi:hypothetical protein